MHTNWPDAIVDIVSILGAVLFVGFFTGSIKINIGRKKQ
jgi:hypothetical protein